MFKGVTPMGKGNFTFREAKPGVDDDDDEDEEPVDDEAGNDSVEVDVVLLDLELAALTAAVLPPIA